MQKDLFELFYTRNIDVIASDLIKANPGFTYHPNQTGVYEEYLNQKTMIKMLLKNDQSSSNTFADAALLDGHKIAACITCAIIKVRLITYDNVDDGENCEYSLEKASRMNEQLALLSGLSCLIAFMLDNVEDLNLLPLNNDKLDLHLPDTYYPERSDYLSSLVRALYYTNTFSSINVLLLANIYFLLDKYHRKSVKLERLMMKKSEC